MCENEQGQENAPDAPDWTEEHWLESTPGGWLLFAIDIVVIVVIVCNLLQGSGTNGDMSEASFSVTRPNILMLTVLGALGYVFTPMFKCIDRSVGKVLEYHFRILGAIPLGFGVFVLSDYLLQNGGIGILGLSFLAGLYVNTFYKRLGAIADWALPSKDTTDEEATGEEATGEEATGEEATEQTDDKEQ